MLGDMALEAITKNAFHKIMIARTFLISIIGLKNATAVLDIIL